MRFFPELLVLFIMSYPGVLLAAETENCALNMVASFDLAGDPSIALVVPVTIQGSPAFMVFNAANAFSSVTEAAAARLSLSMRQLGSGAEITLGKQRIQKVATANGLDLGRIHIQHADFLVISNDTVGSPLVGILGMDVFGHFDIEIDIAARKLNLYSQDHCPGKVVYWTKTYDAVPIRLGKLGEFYFPMELEGKKIESTLGTASAVTALSTDVTRKLFNFDDTSTGVESEIDVAGNNRSHYRAMQLSAQGLSVVNANITLIPRAGGACKLTSRDGATGYTEECMGVHPLKLGLNVLKKLHVYIATKEKVLYFTAGSTPNQPSP